MGRGRLTVSDFDRFGNIIEILQWHAAASSEVPAIVDNNGAVITFAELYSLTLRAAACLSRLGLGQGDRVGLVLQDHSGHLILMLAAAALGLPTLSINWAGKIEEKRAVIDAFKVKLVFHDPGVRVPPGVTAVPLDDRWRGEVERAQPCEPTAMDRQVTIKVMLTSGTTGTPKGVEMTHESVIVMCQAFQGSLNWSTHLRHLIASPFAFAGTYNFCMPLLLSGHTIELFSSVFSPEDLVNAVRRRNITSLVIVPTVLRRLFRVAGGSELLFPDMHCLVSTGGQLGADEKLMARERVASSFFESYGASGCGPISMLQPEDMDRAADSVGRAVPLRELQVVDDSGGLVPANQVGIIRVRGPGTAQGFCDGAASLSGDTFKDGWYYPGELGRLDSDGFLRLAGRASDVIVRGGVNIYPSEIEDTLRRHPTVIDAAVVGIASPEFGEEIVAFFCAAGDTPTQELRELCTRYLAPYKMPIDFIRIETLPKSPAGKVLKSELQRDYRLKHVT